MPNLHNARVSKYYWGFKAGDDEDAWTYLRDDLLVFAKLGSAISVMNIVLTP